MADKKPQESQESKLSQTVDQLNKEDKHGFLVWKQFKAPNLTESEYDAVTKFTNNQSTLFDLLAELEFENKSPLKKFLKIAGVYKIAAEPEETKEEATDTELEDYTPEEKDNTEDKPGLSDMADQDFEEKYPKQNESTEQDDDIEVVRQILEKVQKGLSEGKYYDLHLSEGYVNGEYKEGVEVSAHGYTPDQPHAELTLIYDYLRFDFTKEDYNQGVDLDKYPSTIESDLKFVTTIREHDLLFKDKQKVEKPSGESNE